MQIQNISDIRFSQEGSTCVFALDYRAHFTTDEVNQHYTFADTVRVMEHDPSDDDLVKNWLAEEPWVAQRKDYDWTWTVRVHEDDVDTEIGGEEIYMQVALRNRTTGGNSIVGQARIIQVSPG